MTEKPNIALLGADEPLGEAVLRLIEERGLELGQLFPLTLSSSDGCAVIHGVEEPLCQVADFDWREAQIVLSVVRSPAALRIESIAAEAGCLVVGFGSPGAVPGKELLPGALAQVMQRVLAPLGVGLAGVDAVATLPVGLAGQEGVTELVEQTRALFAMETPEPNVFPLQIAFNLIPQVGAVSPDGESAIEGETAAELRAALDQPDLAVSVTAIWAPVFFGAGIALHVTAFDDIDLVALRSQYSGRNDITLMDESLPGGVPTPATDAQESDSVFVGRLRQPAGQPKRLAMWLVADTTRLEAARIVDWLENLIEK